MVVLLVGLFGPVRGHPRSCRRCLFAAAAAALKCLGNQESLHCPQTHSIRSVVATGSAGAEFGGHVVQFDQAAATEHKRLLDDVFQLADIAGPGIGL